MKLYLHKIPRLVAFEQALGSAGPRAGFHFFPFPDPIGSYIIKKSDGIPRGRCKFPKSTHTRSHPAGPL